MAGQGQPAPAGRGRTAGRVLPGARQRPPRGASPDPPQRRPPPPRQQARRPETGPLPGITVRVIQYILTVTAEDGTVRTERYRHLTTLTDWRAYPAADLAACYAWRWAVETGYRECKAYLRGPGRVLRGRTPELARQELWAYLAVYQAIRAIIVRAAAGAGLDPDRISFTATLNAAHRTLGAGRDQAADLDATETEILACLIPRREGRICPRAVNKPSSPYPSKHNHTGPLSQHATYTATIPARPPAPKPALTSQNTPETMKTSRLKFLALRQNDMRVASTSYKRSPGLVPQGTAVCRSLYSIRGSIGHASDRSRSTQI